MSDPLTIDSSRAIDASVADRDDRIEQLPLDGVRATAVQRPDADCLVTEIERRPLHVGATGRQP